MVGCSQMHGQNPQFSKLESERIPSSEPNEVDNV